MNQLGPFLALIALAALVLAGLGALSAWWNAETRRLRRGLRKVLGEDPHAMILAPGRGRAAGFNFTSNSMAVAWDGGGWCLPYRIDELVGAELLIDGRAAARAWRGEARQSLEGVGEAQKQVTLRLVFDDPRNPDFGLELWSAGQAVRGSLGPLEAAQEGARWISRTESVFRRHPASSAQRPQPRVAPRAEPEPEPPPAPGAATPETLPLPFDAAPPWEEEEAEQDRASLS